MTYETARHLADTWGLVLLVVLFVGVLVFIFRRGSGERYRRAARIPMDAKESPAPSDRRMNEIKTGITEGVGGSAKPARKDEDDD